MANRLEASVKNKAPGDKSKGYEVSKVSLTQFRREGRQDIFQVLKGIDRFERQIKVHRGYWNRGT
jgi:hypothetical protein